MNFDDITLERAQQLKNLKWNYYDKDVIPAWIADMDFPVAEPIRELLKSIFYSGGLCYAPGLRETPLAELFSQRMQTRYSWIPDPAGFDSMVDIVQAIHIAVKVLCDDDQQVIVHSPAYHPIFSACRNMKREILSNPLLRTREGWQIDFDRLEQEINTCTKLLLLVNPHNPSGKCFRRDELEKLAEISLRHNLFVITDEIHCDLVFTDSGPFIPFAAISPDIAKRTVTFNSATKSHNMGGVRCSLVHYGSDELRKRFDQLPGGIRGGSNSIGHRATCIAWQHCDEWLEYTRQYLLSNRDFFIDFLARELPNLSYVPNEATFLAWVDCRKLGIKEDPALYFLREARVGAYSGELFGKEGVGHIRINFATSRSILKEMLERMVFAVRKL